MVAERMDCTQVLQEVYAFLDGECTEARRAVIRTHLDDCSPCLEAYDFEAEVKLLLAQKCRDCPPDDLRERILRALQQQP
jgi:mycothiol system anti-sigma-R factor